MPHFRSLLPVPSTLHLLCPPSSLFALLSPFPRLELLELVKCLQEDKNIPRRVCLHHLIRIYDRHASYHASHNLSYCVSYLQHIELKLAQVYSQYFNLQYYNTNIIWYKTSYDMKYMMPIENTHQICTHNKASYSANILCHI